MDNLKQHNGNKNQVVIVVPKNKNHVQCSMYIYEMGEEDAIPRIVSTHDALSVCLMLSLFKQLKCSETHFG